MINLKIIEMTQQKIKELKLYNIDDIYYFIFKSSLDSKIVLHLSNVKLHYNMDLQNPILWTLFNYVAQTQKMSLPLNSLRNYEKFEYKVDHILNWLNFTLFTHQTMHYGTH
jgi:hypothetical protein